MISKRAIEIFERAKSRAYHYKHLEIDLLNSVQEIDLNHVYIEYQCGSTFSFCTTKLDMNPSLAYNLINIARKAREVPELATAVAAGLPVTKARRIVPVITPANQQEWIDKARELSKFNLEREVAAVNPVLVETERAQPSAADRVKVEFFTSVRRFEDLSAARDLVSNAIGKPANFDETIAHAIDYYLF